MIKLFNLEFNKEKEIYKRILFDLIKKKNFVKGSEIKDFEQLFRKKIGTKYCISCNSGSDALFAILYALGIRRGDEVITTSHSWISTSEAITRLEAKPVFVDTREDFNIDEEKIEKKITKKTKALLIVHLYGVPCNMTKILKICRKNKIFLIEDCAQAHFSKYKQNYVGTFGVASAFSFFPTKNLGSFGDSGCVLTNSKFLEKKIRMLFSHGSLNKKNFNFSGINSRMDTFQSKILDYKIRDIQKQIRIKEKIFKLYIKYLSDIPEIILPKIPKYKKPFFYLFTILVSKNRDKLQYYLKKKGIESAIYYEIPLPFQKVYKVSKKNKLDFSQTINNHRKMLSLPMHINLKEKDIKYCCTIIKKFFS